MFGISFAFSSPTGPDLQDEGKLDNEELSWYSSIPILGALVGAVLASLTGEAIGRKKGLVLMIVTGIIGWCLMMAALHSQWSHNAFIWTLQVGRFITGVSGGQSMVVFPVFVTEMASKQLRGLFTASVIFLWDFGILFVYILGIPLHAKWLSLIALLLSILCVALLPLLPETPAWLMKKNRPEDARQSMLWVRGKGYDVNKELQEIEDGIKAQAGDAFRLSDFKHRYFSLPFVIGIFLGVFQVASGVFVVVPFSSKIIMDAGFDSQPKVISVATGAILLGITIIPALLVDRFGRRVFMLISTSLACLSLFLIGLYFYLTEVKQVTGITALSVTSILVFFLAFSLGLGPVVFTLLGEIVPPKARSLAVGVSMIFAYTFGFAQSKEFLDMLETLTTYGTFWLFSGINLFATVFIAILVPETKGKSVEEIEKHFHSHK